MPGSPRASTTTTTRGMRMAMTCMPPPRSAPTTTTQDALKHTSTTITIIITACVIVIVIGNSVSSSSSSSFPPLICPLSLIASRPRGGGSSDDNEDSRGVCDHDSPSLNYDYYSPPLFFFIVRGAFAQAQYSCHHNVVVIGPSDVTPTTTTTMQYCTVGGNGTSNNNNNTNGTTTTIIPGPGSFNVAAANASQNTFTFTILHSVLRQGLNSEEALVINAYRWETPDPSRRLYVNISNNTFADVVIRITGTLPQASRVDITNNRFLSASVPRGAILQLYVIQLESLYLTNWTTFRIQRNNMKVGHDPRLSRKYIISSFDGPNLFTGSEYLIEDNTLIFGRDPVNVSTSPSTGPATNPTTFFIAHDTALNGAIGTIMIFSGSQYAVRRNQFYVDLPTTQRTATAADIRGLTTPGATSMIAFKAIDLKNPDSAFRIDGNRFYSYVSVRDGGSPYAYKTPVTLTGIGRTSFTIAEGASASISQNSFFFDVVLDDAAVAAKTANQVVKESFSILECAGAREGILEMTYGSTLVIDLNTATIETNRSNFYLFLQNQTELDWAIANLRRTNILVSYQSLITSTKTVRCEDPDSRLVISRNDLSRSLRVPNATVPTAALFTMSSDGMLDLSVSAGLILFGNRLPPGMVISFFNKYVNIQMSPMPALTSMDLRDDGGYVPRYGLANGGSGVFHQLLLPLPSQQAWALLPLTAAANNSSPFALASDANRSSAQQLLPYFQLPNLYGQTTREPFWLTCLNAQRNDAGTPLGSDAEARIATSPSALLAYQIMSPADGARWMLTDGLTVEITAANATLWCRDTQTASSTPSNPSVSASPNGSMSLTGADLSKTATVSESPNKKLSKTQTNTHSTSPAIVTPTHTPQPRHTASAPSTQSASQTRTLPLPVPPPQLTDTVPPAVGATIAITAGVVAADLQAQGVLQLSACSQAKSRAAPGAYRTLSPAALSDTCSGVLAGQTILLTAVPGLSFVAVCLMVMVKGVSILQACATLRCPSIALSVTAMVLNGLLVCGAELAGGGVGVPALLAAAAIPAAFPLLSWAFGTREYHLLPPLAAGPGAGRAKRWLCAALAVAMPRGDWGEDPARTAWARALSSVVGPWRLPHPLWSLTPFAGVAALVPVVAASGSGCTPLHGLSAALHGAAAIAVVVVRPRRVPLADVLHGLSLAVNGGIVAVTAVQLRASEEGNNSPDTATAAVLLLLARLQVALTTARIAVMILTRLYHRLFRWAQGGVHNATSHVLPNGNHQDDDDASSLVLPEGEDVEDLRVPYRVIDPNANPNGCGPQSTTEATQKSGNAELRRSDDRVEDTDASSSGLLAATTAVVPIPGGKKHQLSGSGENNNGKNLLVAMLWKRQGWWLQQNLQNWNDLDGRDDAPSSTALGVSMASMLQVPLLSQDNDEKEVVVEGEEDDQNPDPKRNVSVAHHTAGEDSADRHSRSTVPLSELLTDDDDLDDGGRPRPSRGDGSGKNEKRVATTTTSATASFDSNKANHERREVVEREEEEQQRRRRRGSTMNSTISVLALPASAAATPHRDESRKSPDSDEDSDDPWDEHILNSNTRRKGRLDNKPSSNSQPSSTDTPRSGGGWQRSLEEQRSLYVGHVSSYREVLHNTTPTMSFAASTDVDDTSNVSAYAHMARAAAAAALSSVPRQSFARTATSTTTTPIISSTSGAATTPGDDDGFVSFHGMRVRSKSTTSRSSHYHI